MAATGRRAIQKKSSYFLVHCTLAVISYSWSAGSFDPFHPLTPPLPAPFLDYHQPFQFGRFLKTLVFFTGPRRPRVPWSRKSREARKARKAASSASSAASHLPKHLAGGGVVLVTGATGGVGRRVLQELRRRGLHVRAMVRASVNERER